MNNTYLKIKPKHRLGLFTHYPTIIKMSGPPKHFCTMMYEFKHSKMKQCASSTTSSRNISLSIAKKFQLKFPNYLLEEVNLVFTITNKIDSKYSTFITDKLDLYKQHYYSVFGNNIQRCCLQKRFHCNEVGRRISCW